MIIFCSIFFFFKTHYEITIVRTMLKNMGFRLYIVLRFSDYETMETNFTKKKNSGDNVFMEKKELKIKI